MLISNDDVLLIRCYCCKISHIDGGYVKTIVKGNYNKFVNNKTYLLEELGKMAASLSIYK